jgi:hypothetical protein
MRKLYIEIVADTNDGDYVTQKTEVTPDGLTFTFLNKVIKAIEDRQKQHQEKYSKTKDWQDKIHHNWITSEFIHDWESHPFEEYKEFLTEEEIEKFEEYLPYGEYGIHTIKSIKMYWIEEVETLYQHSYWK